MMASRCFAHLRAFVTTAEVKMVSRLHITIIHRKLSSSVYTVVPRMYPYTLRRHKETFHQVYHNWISILGTSYSTLVDSEKIPGIEHKQNQQSGGEIVEESAHLLTDELVEELSGGDSGIKKKIKLIELEYEVLKQSGSRVPSYIKAEKWKELIDLTSRGQRTRFFEYLFISEKKKLNERAKKEEKRIKREQSSELMDYKCKKYSLFQNSLFQRISLKHEAAFYNSILIQALQFGQPLVFDCSYDVMSRKDTRNCADQLQQSFGSNRVHKEPFNLYLCNASRESILMKDLNNFIPPMYNSYFPLNITENSYLDLFPKDRLIYLTPNCSEVMEIFDNDAIYIIGALVDKSISQPLSLAKAKREGLKMLKLPLDKHLDWGIGNKSLTLDQMINILLEIKYTKDWKKALRFVPTRKLRKLQSLQEQGLRSLSPMKKRRKKTNNISSLSLFDDA